MTIEDYAIDVRSNRDRTLRRRAARLKLKPWSVILKDKDHGWSPLLWVLYLGFFFVRSDREPRQPARYGLLDGIGAAVFLVLYFGLFALENPRALVHIGGMVAARHSCIMPINGGAHVLYLRGGHAPVLCRDASARPSRAWAPLAAIGAIEGLLPAHQRLEHCSIPRSFP